MAEILIIDFSDAENSQNFLHGVKEIILVASREGFYNLLIRGHEI